MTEQEWLTSTNPAAMLAIRRTDCCGCLWFDNGDGTVSLAGGARPCGLCDNGPILPYTPISDRQLRLFACACVRQVWHTIDARSRYAISIAEAYADELVSAMECELAAKEASNADDESFLKSGKGQRIDWAASWASDTRHSEIDNALRTMLHLPANDVVQADLLRDIVGNPFRPVTLPLTGAGDECPHCRGAGTIGRMEAVYECDPCGATGKTPGFCPWLTWNGACIPALAAEIYESRAWDRLPILADALEEAGCPQTTEQPCPECSPYVNDPCPHCDGKRTVMSRGVWSEFDAPVRCPACQGIGKFPPGYRPERDPASGRHEGGWTNCKMCNDSLQPTKGIVRVRNPLLAHLRGPGPHVRGCWALDKLLGKE